MNCNIFISRYNQTLEFLMRCFGYFHFPQGGSNSRPVMLQEPIGEIRVVTLLFYYIRAPFAMLIPGFIKNNRRLLKLFRFCAVGGTAFLLSILVFNILKNSIYFFSVHFVIASVIGDLSGLVYGFYINKHWTYSSQKNEEEKYFFKYLTLYAITITLNGLFLKGFIWLLTHYTIFDESISQNIKENIAKVCATLITTGLNFIGTNYVIFVHEEGYREEAEGDTDNGI